MPAIREYTEMSPFAAPPLPQPGQAQERSGRPPPPAQSYYSPQSQHPPPRHGESPQNHYSFLHALPEPLAAPSPLAATNSNSNFREFSSTFPHVGAWSPRPNPHALLHTPHPPTPPLVTL